MENNTGNGADNSAPVVEAVELQDNNQPAGEQTPVVPKLTKKLKLKLDDQEFDEELPFEFDENNKAQVEYLKRHLQMSKVAQSRMNQAAHTRKQAEQFIQALQNDPMRVLSNPQLMGEEKFQKIAEEFLARKIQDQMMSPEEKRQREMEDRLRKYEEQEKQVKEQAEQKQVQELQSHYQEQYTKTITQALDSSNLPKNPFTVRRMAELMQKNLKHGLELEPQLLAQLVREDYQKELSSLIGSSNPDQIISMFGDEVTNKLRKYDLEKMRSSLAPNSGRQVSKNSNFTPAEPTKPKKWDDFTEEIKKKIKD